MPRNICRRGSTRLVKRPAMSVASIVPGHEEACGRYGIPAEVLEIRRGTYEGRGRRASCSLSVSFGATLANASPADRPSGACIRMAKSFRSKLPVRLCVMLAIVRSSSPFSRSPGQFHATMPVKPTLRARAALPRGFIEDYPPCSGAMAGSARRCSEELPATICV